MEIGDEADEAEEAMSDEYEKKTWTPQQVPQGVPGAKPTQDKEPAPEPPKEPKERR